MSEEERQMAELMRAVVGDPPGLVTASSVRRLVQRRRALAVVAGAAALALVAGVTAGVSARTVGPGQGGGPAAAAAQPPAYYIEEGGPNLRDQFTTVVRSTATGKVTDTVRCPQHKGPSYIPSMAAADDQTFFIVCGSVNKRLVLSQGFIYRFSLTSAGRISGYALVRGGRLGKHAVGTMAVTPDGSELAVVLGPVDKAPFLNNSEILVINARTGARAVWRNDTAPGAPSFRIVSLSLTGDGRELVFLGAPPCKDIFRGRQMCEAVGTQVRALLPVADGGLLDSGRVLLRKAALASGTLQGLANAVISPDGSRLAVMVTTWPRQANQKGVLAEVQVTLRTGHTRVLFKARTVLGFPYRFSSADPSGRYVMADVGPGNTGRNGWIKNGKLIRLAPRGDTVYYEAW